MNLDSTGYCTILDTTLTPSIAEYHKRRAIFIQDNAPMQTSKDTQQCFSENFVVVLEWLAACPDASTIEDIWDIMVHKVRNSGTQLDTIDDLKLSLMTASNQIEESVLHSLVNSFPSRLVSIVESREHPIPY